MKHENLVSNELRRVKLTPKECYEADVSNLETSLLLLFIHINIFII